MADNLDRKGEAACDVLVVGTGPAGATCALALATYGLRVIAVTKRNWLANTPRAHITNQRALEVLRDLGVEEQAMLVGTPWEFMGEMVFATSLAGMEIARLHAWGTGEDRHCDYLKGSPCPLLDIPQPLLEPILVEAAAARGATLLFNTEYLEHSANDAGVRSVLVDRVSGRKLTIDSQFLVGADGANSRVVEELQLPVEGHMGRGGTVYARFKADLTRYVEHRPSTLYRIMIPAYGEIGFTTLRAVRPWTEWIAGWGYDIDGPEPDKRPNAVIGRIREVVGDPAVDVEVLDVITWKINQAWATRYSQSPVFCCGDAVHRHPPSSGLGSNTSIQDAFNLAWKLAYVIKGWADPDLLESYTEERAPVGRQVVARANQSRADYAPLNELLRGERTKSDRSFVELLQDSGPEGIAARDALVVAVDRKNYEFNAQGVEMNQRYRSRAILTDEDAEPEVWRRDRELYLQASTRPGAKLPHSWLVNAKGYKISTLDVTGRGKFTLVTGVAGTAWADAVAQLPLPFLRVVVIGSPGTGDPYGAWYRMREIEESGAILVRPDGYVAWRHCQTIQTVGDAKRKLLEAVDSVLCRTQGERRTIDVEGRTRWACP